MWVDFHWHARDEEQKAQETVQRSLLVAEAAGLDALGAMPNLKRPLVTRKRCEEYLALSNGSPTKVKFFVHAGLTAEPEQIKRIVVATRDIRGICGIKSYFGRSTGDLSIIDPNDQHRALQTLAKEGYEGVLVCHLEDESCMDDSAFDINNPITWSTHCRPERAEVSSYETITRMAEEVGFKGLLHVAHVSTLDVVDAIHAYQGPLRLSCGVTPHHLLRSYHYLEGDDGAHYKCNPPLRKPETQQGLLERVLDGRIPIVESDHAPHLEEAKRSDKPPSGIASGTAWPYITSELLRRGMCIERLHDVTFSNPVSLYNVDVECRERPVDFDTLEKLQSAYAFDAFKDIGRD